MLKSLTEEDDPRRSQQPNCPDEEGTTRQNHHPVCERALSKSLTLKKHVSSREGQLEITKMNRRIPAREKAALERLIRIAQAATGQGRMTATFLLSWWNASNFGGFDLTTLWNVDPEIAADMVTVFSWVSRCRHFPDDMGYDEQFRRIVHTWSPPTGSADSEPLRGQGDK